jgi:hypothetical protein
MKHLQTIGVIFSEHLGVLMTTTYNCKNANNSVGENPL